VLISNSVKEKDWVLMVEQKNRPFCTESGGMKSETVGETATDYLYVVEATDPSRNLSEDSNRVGEFDRGTTGGTKQSG
jgi:hypothetical protein